MRFVTLLTILIALSTATEAEAQLRIDEARMDDRMLIVRGAVGARGQMVTLDQKFTTRSGRGGEFSFRVRHWPFVCRIEVRAGGVQRTKKVANCVMDDTRSSIELRRR